MRIAGIRRNSLVDGFGVNYVIFLQGCSHNCKGCHNPHTHDYAAGYEITIDELFADITKQKELITGITFSGGEPLDQLSEVAELALKCKSIGLNTTLYTGYDLTHQKPVKANEKQFGEWADLFDYIIDGLFVLKLKDTNSPFRGSSNQRILRLGLDY